MPLPGGGASGGTRSPRRPQPAAVPALVASGRPKAVEPQDADQRTDTVPLALIVSRDGRHEAPLTSHGVPEGRPAAWSTGCRTQEPAEYTTQARPAGSARHLGKRSRMARGMGVLLGGGRSDARPDLPSPACGA